MKIENIKEIIKESSLLESSDIESYPELIGDLIQEGYTISVATEICNSTPLTKPSGYIFGAKKEGSKLKVVKSFVEAEDHILITDITKESVDDIYSLYKEKGIEIINGMIKKELFLEQDSKIIEFMKTIAKETELIEISYDTLEDHEIKLQQYIDEQALKMAIETKGNPNCFIIGSAKVIGLLMNDNNTDVRPNMASFIGKWGNRSLILDYNTTEDYIMIGIDSSKEMRGVVFCPYNLNVSYSTKYGDGSSIIRVNNRYGLSRNPLDNTGVNDSKFIVKAKVQFKNTSGLTPKDVEEFIDGFNDSINN